MANEHRMILKLSDEERNLVIEESNFAKLKLENAPMLSEKQAALFMVSIACEIPLECCYKCYRNQLRCARLVNHGSERIRARDVV